MPQDPGSRLRAFWARRPKLSQTTWAALIVAAISIGVAVAAFRTGTRLGYFDPGVPTYPAFTTRPQGDRPSPLPSDSAAATSPSTPNMPTPRRSSAGLRPPRTSPTTGGLSGIPSATNTSRTTPPSSSSTSRVTSQSPTTLATSTSATPATSAPTTPPTSDPTGGTHD